MGPRGPRGANDTPEGKRPANRTLEASEAMPTTAGAGDADGAKTAQKLRCRRRNTAKTGKRAGRKTEKHENARFSASREPRQMSVRCNTAGKQGEQWI